MQHTEAQLAAASPCAKQLARYGFGSSSLRDGHCSPLLSCDTSQDSLDTSRGCSSWLHSSPGSSRRPGSSSTITCGAKGPGAGGGDGLECCEEMLEEEEDEGQSLAQEHCYASSSVPATIRYDPGPVDREVLRNEYARQHECSASRSPLVSRETRSRAMAWLVEIADTAQLHSNTLFLAAAYFDSFLSATKTAPPGGLLQLMALACMSLACKQFETEHKPATYWLVFARTDKDEPIFQRDDLLKMEWLVLETLEWRMRVPTVHSFLHLLIPALSQAVRLAVPAADGQCGRQRMASIASYLSELSLLDARFLDHSYSTTAAACLVLAEFLAMDPTLAMNVDLSTKDLLPEYIPLDNSSLKDCVAYLHELHAQARARSSPIVRAVAERFYGCDLVVKP